MQASFLYVEICYSMEGVKNSLNMYEISNGMLAFISLGQINTSTEQLSTTVILYIELNL